MKFLVIQENGRHQKNRNFRECYCLQRSLIKSGNQCDIWGLGHSNFNIIPQFDSYDVIVDLENSYRGNWIPDLSLVKAYKILWSIDSHCMGLEHYKYRFYKNKCQLLLQATNEFVRCKNDIWFPNCFDHTLIYPKDVIKKIDVGFCGNIVNRASYLELLKNNFSFKADIFVIGEDMVDAINSYRIHFNKNIDIDINYRNFETIGCKIPLVTSYNHNYSILGIEDGKNCMIYKDNNELIYKIKVILSNESLLNNIANNGYELSKNHTYDARVNYLMDILSERV